MRRFAFALLLVGCGPRVGGDDQGSGEGTAGEGSSTSTSTTPVDASSSETSEAGCERDALLQWERWGHDLAVWPDAAVSTPDGHIVVAGSTPSLGLSDVPIELRDAAGDLLWSATYSGVSDLSDRARDVAVDDQGDVYVLVAESVTDIAEDEGWTRDERLVVLRYDSAGTFRWRWEREREPVMMLESYFVEGALEVVGNRVLVLEYDRSSGATTLLELDRGGNLLSELGLAIDEDEDFLDRDLASDGDVAVVHRTGDPDDQELVLERFARDGTSRWRHRLASGEQADAVIAAASGETYFASTRPEAHAEATIDLHRFEADGSEAWTRELVATNPEERYVFGDVAPDGSVLVTVFPVEQRAGGESLWIARYAPDGCRVWIFEYDSPSILAPLSARLVVSVGNEATLVLAMYNSMGWPGAWMGLIGE